MPHGRANFGIGTSGAARSFGWKMGEIVNLRRARKDAKRREDAVRAAENRLTHGRSKAKRALEEARAEKARRELDAHRLETEDGR
jgi:Domain of unknown function (DUF4169)